MAGYFSEASGVSTSSEEDSMQSQQLERLRVGLGPRHHIGNAQRIWEIWKETEQFEHATAATIDHPMRTPEANRFWHFSRISGLPEDFAKKAVVLCRKIEGDLAEHYRRKLADRISGIENNSTR